MRQRSLFFASLLAVTTLPLLSGCARQSSVSGKVTLNGKAVAGQIAFVGADSAERIAPINPDGTYRIVNPPQGDVKIVIKRFNIVQSTPHRSGMKLAPIPGGTLASGTLALAPPPRYASPASGLTFTVTGGAQTFDIPLRP